MMEKVFGYNMSTVLATKVRAPGKKKKGYMKVGTS